MTNAADRELLLSSADQQAAFCALLVHAQNQAMEAQIAGPMALSMALAGALTSPGDCGVLVGERQQPVLSAVLCALDVQRQRARSDDWDLRCVDVSLDPQVPLPPHVAHLPAFERLAIWLLRQGANPWQTESAGQDALDWALSAGARTTVAMMLAHPTCPSQEQLAARTTNTPGRAVPWMHALAYLGLVDLFDDLVGRGWDPVSRDRNNWVPAAWVNTTADLEHILRRHPQPVDNVLSVELNAAWGKRDLLKLKTHDFVGNQLVAKLKSHTQLTPEEESQLRLEKTVEQWLAATPSKNYYQLPGPKWQHLHSLQENAEIIALMTQRFDCRTVVKSGTAKGTWSPLAAMLWSATRGESNVQSAMKQVVVVFQQVLAAQPTEQVLAWLEEEIRPGLSNRGLAVWALADHAATCEALSLGLAEDLQACRAARVQAASDVMVSMCGKSPTRQWSSVLADRWLALCTAEGLLGHAPTPDWFWSAVAPLASRGLFRPNQETYPRLITRAQRALEGEASDAIACLPAITGLLMITPWQLSGMRYGNRNSADTIDVHRLSLWTALQQRLDQSPLLVQKLGTIDYPFADKKTEIEKGTSDLPAAITWEAMLNRARLLEVSQQAALEVGQSGGLEGKAPVRVLKM